MVEKTQIESHAFPKIEKRAPELASLLRRGLHKLLDMLEAKARVQFRTAFMANYERHQEDLPEIPFEMYRFKATFVGDAKPFTCTSKAKDMRPTQCNRRMDRIIDQL